MKHNLWKNQRVICLTFDVDWASEDAIKYTYNFIDKYKFSSTFFLTHNSPFLTELINNKSIHGGIHPNFLENSSHGNNNAEIIDYCTNLLPKAISFRCHKYYDDNDINELLYQKGFRYDSNLCTLLEKVDPFIHRSGMLRFPIYFEDGAYLYHRKNLEFRAVKLLFKDPGLMVINFHPMHIALNTPDFGYMRKIKDKLSRDKWNSLNQNELDLFAYEGSGLRNFFLDLLEYISVENILVLNLEELYNAIFNDIIMLQ